MTSLTQGYGRTEPSNTCAHDDDFERHSGSFSVLVPLMCISHFFLVKKSELNGQISITLARIRLQV